MVLILEVSKFDADTLKICSNTNKNKICKIWSRFINPNTCPKRVL